MNAREDAPGHYERRDDGGQLFADRADAGKQLAAALAAYRGKHALVLALPRGGVPVAHEIAMRIGGELDVLVARKLGAPDQEELAIGAVMSDGTRFLNEEIVRSLGVSQRYLDQVTEAEKQEAKRREQRFRAGLSPLAPEGRTVILVDDGLATGATMRAAVWAMRRANPAKLVVAVPVGAVDSCKVIEAEVDDFVCLKRPPSFYAVGMYYRDFEQTSDEEVTALLHEHRSGRTSGRGPLLPRT